MEIDLNRLELQAEPLRAQVCIVGAGIAGLTLAWRLAQLGIEVALLEAGGHASSGVEPSLLAGAQLQGHPHRGTAEGRLCAFGGNSLTWGGQLLPLPEDAAWSIAAAELAPYSRQAERLLGVDDLPYAAADFFAAGLRPPALLTAAGPFTATLSKWTPFARRNLAATLGRELLASPHVRVYLNAAVTELLPDASCHTILAAHARNRRGDLFRFAAERFVVAAGTVETVRLLLASRSASPQGIGNAHGQLGRNFHDHLTLPAATLSGAARARLLHELRPWVTHRRGRATLHSAKLEARLESNSEANLEAKHGGLSIHAHLTLEEPEGTGLAALRDWLTLRQRGDRGQLPPLATLPAAAWQATRLAWSAAVAHRRFVSSGARVTLYLNAAQIAPSRSTISLSEDRDAHGMPQPCVDWRIEPEELAALRRFAHSLRARLEGPEPWSSEPGFAWAPDLFAAAGPLPDLTDARHAMGGACMGTDPRSSVVDPQLAVHGLDNLSLASAAVFPNGAPPMPTLPLMALSLRLADRLADRFATRVG